MKNYHVDSWLCELVEQITNYRICFYKARELSLDKLEVIINKKKEFQFM